MGRKTLHVERLRNVAAGTAGWLDIVTEHWLGYTRPPVRTALHGWSVDAPDDYCRRCGESVGPGEQTETGCGACRGSRVPADAVIRLGRYEDPLREWVLAVKYDGWAEMGVELGARLGLAVREAGVARPGICVVVPAPMPWQRRLYRGIDHAAVIAAGAAGELDAPLERLLRRGNGPPQIVRSAELRRRRGGRGLWLATSSGARAVAGRDVILVDDVRTTGGTARAAVRLLRRLRPRCVVLAVIAVTDGPGRRGRQSLAPLMIDDRRGAQLTL